MKFTKSENKVLSEVYRRLNHFHNGNVNEKLMLLSIPSKVKSLIQKDILVPYGKELKNVGNWYSLTEKGKQLFQKHITAKPLTNEESHELFFEHKIIDFNQ